MFNWNYDPNCYDGSESHLLAEGKYRVCVTNAVP